MDTFAFDLKIKILGENSIEFEAFMFEDFGDFQFQASDDRIYFSYFFSIYGWYQVLQHQHELR